MKDYKLKLKYILFYMAIVLISSCDSKKLVHIEFTTKLRNNQKITYTFEQIQTSKINKYLKFETNDSSLRKTFGQIVIESSNGKDISLSLINQIDSTISTEFNGDTIINRAPPQILQGFNQFGENSLNPDYDYFYLELFPLPYHQISNKKQYNIPVSMPFNANGSLLEVKGIYKIRIIDTVKINNHNCFKIVSEFSIDKLTVPQELDGEYIYNESGKFNGYFDYENLIYIEGRRVSNTHMKVYSKVGDEYLGQEFWTETELHYIIDN